MTGQPLPSPSDSPPDADPEQPNSHAVPVDRVEHLLANGSIEMKGTMLWGSNYAALVTISDAGLLATAVYKPQRGERPLWDFPDGTLCRREVATYVVSQALGWQLVPPTVLRQGPHGLGSFQLFIEHNPEINYFSLDDRFVAQLQRFAILDILVNNADRKGGHLLLDARGKLWGIDHGLTFHTMPKLRTVIWEFAEDAIADDLLATLRAFEGRLASPDHETHRKLAPLLSPAEIEALHNRTKHLLAKKTYPAPGPGRSYPWPPV
ncbi:MAG: SCO1664 family protein [Anaerolineae bacterium]|nr:SCO1664 family protein [Anaerolineae bacterium]